MRSLRFAMIVALGLAAGCDTKSFINPGEVGRWQRKPLAVPILNTLDASVEEPETEFLNASDPSPTDLVAQAEDYLIGRNDLLLISITDLVAPGVETIRQARVSESGRISLPLIGQVQAMGKTEAQLETEISEAYRDANLIQNAQVSVTISELQSRTFSIRGNVTQPGRYAIINSDFRLLDALVLARDVADPLQEYIYVIRRTDLVEGDVRGGQGLTPDSQQPASDPLAPQSRAGKGPSWVALLQANADAPAPTDAPAPDATPVSTDAQVPAPDATADPTDAQEPAPAADAPAVAETQAPADATDAPAVVNGDEPASEGRYIIIDGKPVLIEDGQMTQTPNDLQAVPDDQQATSNEQQATNQPAFEFSEPEYTQNTRVIRIPYQDLNNGDLKYNIVVRPFDMIVVPNPIVGEYYMGGHANVTGAYSLTARKITLKQAVVAARGLDGIAIPQRTEIIRRIGDDKEIFVRVDLDKIFDGQQPDIYLKPNDIVNVGTNAIAPFIAAIRNGFRVTYGFGFLYDRNYYDEDDDNN